MFNNSTITEGILVKFYVSSFRDLWLFIDFFGMDAIIGQMFMEVFVRITHMLIVVTFFFVLVSELINNANKTINRVWCLNSRVKRTFCIWRIHKTDDLIPITIQTVFNSIEWKSSVKSLIKTISESVLHYSTSVWKACLEYWSRMLII